MSPSRRILGIDPGLERTGYGFIEINSDQIPRLIAHGIFRSSRKLSLNQRLSILYDQIISFLAEHKPSVVVLEELYSHYEHPTTAILMGHARGVICLTAAQKQIPLVSYAATRVKKAVTSNGGASKEQVHRMVCHLLGVGELAGSWDVTDALALAIAHANVMRLHQKTHAEYREQSTENRVKKIEKGNVICSLSSVLSRAKRVP